MCDQMTIATCAHEGKAIGVTPRAKIFAVGLALSGSVVACVNLPPGYTDGMLSDYPNRDAGIADTTPATCGDAGPVDPTMGPSCAGGLMCGCVSCCDAKLVPGSTGGTLPMGRSESGTDVCPPWGTYSCKGDELPEHSATVSDFRLDAFEVTVGRFRKFVAAYPGSKPSAGAGAHPKIGASSGWNVAWPLPADQAALTAALKCDVQTWTDGSVAGTENEPIDCVDWYMAFAFCAWDGGRLPTEAEWEYAAAGGSENRLLPWTGTDEPDCTRANNYSCGGGAELVGSAPLGASRWGHHDLLGNVSEWTLDEWASYTSAPCNDCANTSFDLRRVYRGGGFEKGSPSRAASRYFQPPASIGMVGFRCARSP
jgi:sulfatase modifying factor 1